MSAPLVILDRDGVINVDRADYIKHRDEWVPIPGAIEAVARLSRAGVKVAIATNQSGIARGLIPPDELTAMHERLLALVEAAGGELAHIAYCPHGPDEGCRCRKPKPGMLHDIAAALGYATLTDAWMVGDSLRDLQAGVAAGTKVALVLTGNGKKTQQQLDALPANTHVHTAASLEHLVDDWLAHGTLTASLH